MLAGTCAAVGCTTSADDPDSALEVGGKADQPDDCDYDCPAPDPTADEAATLALNALGGRDALTALRTLEVAAEGTRAWADESFAPGEPESTNEYQTRLAFDAETAALAIDISRRITFAGFDVEQSHREVLHGDAGHVAGIESVFGFPTGDLSSDRAAAIRFEQRLLHPQLIALDLLEQPELARALDDAELDGRAHRRVEIARDVAPLVLWIDAGAQTLSAITTMENDPLRRDVEVAVRYHDWATSPSGVRTAGRLELRHAGQLVIAETRGDVVVDGELQPGTFALPEEAMPVFVAEDAARGERNHGWHRAFAASGLPQQGLQTHVEAIEVAPGVHHLTGGSHHSVVIEQDDGVVVLEAPLYEARAEAILAWIDETLGTQPTTHVVVSHFHQDHSAGARTFVAAGATLVTGDGSQAMWKQVLEAESTLQPDPLAAAYDVEPDVLVVGEGSSVLLADERNPVRVYDLPNTHAVDLVVPVIETANTAFIADLYSPGSPFQIDNGPRETLEGLEALGLTATVEVLVGAHGQGTATLADLEAAVAAAQAE